MFVSYKLLGTSQSTKLSVPYCVQNYRGVCPSALTINFFKNSLFLVGGLTLLTSQFYAWLSLATPCYLPISKTNKIIKNFALIMLYFSIVKDKLYSPYFQGVICKDSIKSVKIQVVRMCLAHNFRPIVFFGL